MAGGAYAFFPLVGEDGIVRFFAGGRDADGRSRVGIVVVKWGDAPRVVDVTDEPVLDLGDHGAFDVDGVSYPWLVETGSVLRLYFTGWRRLTGDVPWTTQLGLAVSDDGGFSFKRVTTDTIMPATVDEPIGVGSVCVTRDRDQWLMYYTRLFPWNVGCDPPRPYYNIWEAASLDGITWQPTGVNVVPDQNGEYAVAAPSLFETGRERQLYFTARGHRYRLFASADVGGTFNRLPGPIAIPSSDWDDDMQCYPHVREIEGKRYLFYCGNGYGRSGVGFAEWVPSTNP
jgi:hypothetical protein